MTKKQFKRLKVSHEVTLNGICRLDIGTRCKVTYICDDRIWVEPIEGKLNTKYSLTDMNEVSYKAVKYHLKRKSLQFAGSFLFFSNPKIPRVRFSEKTK